MLYDERAARDNIRNSGGKRVFYLGQGDQLTPSARDFLNRERIQILHSYPTGVYRILGGGTTDEKPEHMTHLNGDVLVNKTHPVIRFRGSMDLLEGEIMLTIGRCAQQKEGLEELLALARQLIACDVLQEPVKTTGLLGLDDQQLRQHSHTPQKYYGQPHFMPQPTDKPAVLELNRLRALIRRAELDAACAFADRDGLPTRTDILQALNRMSAAAYIMMIKEKAK